MASAHWSIAELAEIAVLDGYPRPSAGRHSKPWTGLLADLISERLEAVDADARRSAALLWSLHTEELLEAGKRPWFLDEPYRAPRSSDLELTA